MNRLHNLVELPHPDGSCTWVLALTSQSHSQEQVAAHRFPPTTLST